MANSLWNYAAAGVALVAAIVTTPVYLHLLGLDRFGVLAVLASILAPIGVMNAGVTQAAVKYVASHSAAGDPAAANATVAAALLINTGVGVVGLIACVALAPYLTDLGFKIPENLLPDAQHGMRIVGIAWFVSQVAGSFRGVLEGLRDQRRVMIGDALQSILTALLCSVLAYLTHSLSWFLVGQLVAGILVGGFWWIQARRGLSNLKLTWSAARSHLRQVYGYSIWQVLNAGVAIFANVGDRYFIGVVFNSATLGAYNIVLRLQSIARTVFTAMNQALFPAVSAATTVPGSAERLVVTATWHVSLLAGLVLGWATVCGPAFVELWVGPTIAEQTGFALRILMVTLLFEIPSATGSSYLNAHSLTRLTAYNNIATTVLTIGLMFVLGFKFGLSGVACSGLIGLVLTRIPFQLWMGRRYFTPHTMGGDFLRSFYGVGCCCLLATIAMSPLFDMLFDILRGGAGFVLATACVAPLFFGLVLVLVLHGLRDRARLSELSGQIARRIPLTAPWLGRLGVSTGST